MQNKREFHVTHIWPTSIIPRLQISERTS